jgi:hypothetical protein
MQAIDPAGIVGIAISPQFGSSLKAGSNVILYLDIEAIATGESMIGFDHANVQVSASDGRPVKLQMVESRVVVK